MSLIVVISKYLVLQSGLHFWPAARRYYLSDAYKRKVIEAMSVSQLIDTLLINPTVHLAPSYRDTGLTATYSFQPLSNLVYTRDQQITTCRGIVMGRLRSQQRQKEVNLMRFCFNKLGARVLFNRRKTEPPNCWGVSVNDNTYSFKVFTAFTQSIACTLPGKY